VPAFRHGEGRRGELLGLCQRLHVEVGPERGLELMQAHSPEVADMAGYFASEPKRISPGSIWPFLRDHYGVDISRPDLRGRSRQQQQPPPPRQESTEEEEARKQAQAERIAYMIDTYRHDGATDLQIGQMIVEAGLHIGRTSPPEEPDLRQLPTEEKLARLQELAEQLLEERKPFAQRLPILRAAAEAMALRLRDGELSALLTAARRRLIHGDSDGLLGPGDALELTPTPWAWEGLILRDCLNLLVALPKQGKTSLMVAMIAAWWRNDPAFLDRNLWGPCPLVLIVGTDQGQADWGRMLQPAGLVDQQGRIGGPIVGLAHAGRPIHLDAEGIDRIAEVAQQHPGLLVVIDSLSACIAPLGLKEESPEVAMPVAELMEQLEPHKATVVLIHHASKGRAGEDASSASRGSTALPALASQTLKLGPASAGNPQDRRRVLTTSGRGGAPQGLVVEREGATWRLLGSVEQLEEERGQAETLNKLTERQFAALRVVRDRWEDRQQRTSAGDLVEELGLTGSDPARVARKTLQALEHKRLLQSVGTPMGDGGGRLYRYWPAAGRACARGSHSAEGPTGPFGPTGGGGSRALEDPERADPCPFGRSDQTDQTDRSDQEPRARGSVRTGPNDRTDPHARPVEGQTHLLPDLDAAA